MTIAVEASEIQTLTSLGLTIIQAKVYLTLAKFGISKITTIAKYSNVARPDVYRTLAQLYELGLVEKILQTPVKYKALPIDEGAKVLLKNKQAEYEKIRKETELLLDSINKKNQNVDTEVNDSHFILIPEKEAVINRLRQAINNAQKTVDTVITWKRFMHGIGNAFIDNAQGASDRKVNYRFIVEKPPSQEGGKYGKTLWKIYPPFQVRFISHLPKTVFGIYDKKELFIIIDPKSDLAGSPALWTNNQSLIALIQEYFEILWLTAREDLKENKKASRQLIKKS